MKKPSFLLFNLRLFLYLSVASIVLIHPGIIVTYDRASLIQWFLIIPLEAFIAFLPPPKGKLRNKLLIAVSLLCILSVWAAGWSSLAFTPFFAGMTSFILTLLLFHYPRWGRISAVEPFFLAWICLRLLAFSRSGEDATGEIIGLTQLIMVWTAVVFLFHSAILYFCFYQGSKRGAKREGLIIAAGAALALSIIIFVLPVDYVRNTVIKNMLPDRIERKSKPSDTEWDIPDRGGAQRRNRPTIPSNGDGQRPTLRRLSEHDWPGEGETGRNNGSQRRQYTVMVVASKQNPVYMGNSFRGRLDPVRGFLQSGEENLNRLPAQRLLVTWFDTEPVSDRGRKEQDVFSLSVLSQKYLPYRPFAIEPTVLSENTGPLRYIHRIISRIYPDDPLILFRTPGRELRTIERSNLATYLELSIPEADKEIFQIHLDRVMESRKERRGPLTRGQYNEHIDKILAILEGFSDFQYHVNSDDDSTIANLIHFLVNTKNGDCVEFSNTAALLGRLAGIPSRVVTGYLASEDLQTAAHLQGLASLRNMIPILQDFPFEDLFLVTDSHGHSWTQFYIPDYGWLDFETTSYAIPPISSGDANLRDVVIPQMDGDRLFSSVRAFPWRVVFRTLAFFALLALFAAYALRCGREALLASKARQGGRDGAHALYLLLLARLAAEGKPIKPASKTAPEYAKLFPDKDKDKSFNAFAAIYTELRWRDFTDDAKMEERFQSLENEYRNILKANRRKGLKAALIRIFSLRGLAYL